MYMSTLQSIQLKMVQLTPNKKETTYNRMKGPSFLNCGSLNKFAIITLINIYRVCIYKILFPDNIYKCIIHN